ncbi:MAG TPA: DUF2066 domain-containing protein [Parvularculaceae bacterium]|nr:DUF2066 domain-containing protein [Parvularculaceae bacterium]
MGRFLSLLAIAAGVLALRAGPASASDDVFVVPRVPVQAQADSATKAKQIAQMQGLRHAMDILLRRLTVEEDWIYLPDLADQASGGDGNQPANAAAAPAVDPNAAYDPTIGANPFAENAARPAADENGKHPISLTDNDLETLEQSFEVFSEKNSSTTYRAFITYRFKPDAMRKLFKTAHIPYSETQTRPALVLPVLETDRGVYLWESNNPWMAAWKERPLVNELTPMTAPLGDLEDASIITARQALALDPERLAAIAEHYSVSQVIVAHARLKQQNGQDQLSVRLINAYRDFGPAATDPGVAASLDADADRTNGVEPTDQTMIGPSSAPDDILAKVGDILGQTLLTQPSGDFPALAQRSIEATIAKYSSGWKRKTLIDHSTESLLETTAFFGSLTDWTKIRSGLIATPLVGSVQVFALSRGGAEMRLRVFGDPKRLAVAMANYGVSFWTEDGDQWFLATPSMANKLRGSRMLRRRHDLLGADSASGPTIQPASATDDNAPDTKIDQPN